MHGNPLGSLSPFLSPLLVHSEGRVCAGVSSGGLSLKCEGRVGEAALFGAGCWAELLTPPACCRPSGDTNAKESMNGSGGSDTGDVAEVECVLGLACSVSGLLGCRTGRGDWEAPVPLATPSHCVRGHSTFQ